MITEPEIEKNTLPPVEHLIQDTLKDSLEEKINEMNKTHFVSTEGNSTSVYKEGFNYELNVAHLGSMSFDAFKKLYATERVDVMKGHDQSSNPIIVSKQLAPIWLEHHNRRTYINGLGLFPSAQTVPYGVYNLWRGWGCTPNTDACAMSVKLALRHLYFVVCSV